MLYKNILKRYGNARIESITISITDNDPNGQTRSFSPRNSGLFVYPAHWYKLIKQWETVSITILVGTPDNKLFEGCITIDGPATLDDAYDFTQVNFERWA